MITNDSSVGQIIAGIGFYVSLLNFYVMKLQVHSIHFDADSKLIDFIQKVRTPGPWIFSVLCIVFLDWYLPLIRRILG